MDEEELSRLSDALDDAARDSAECLKALEEAQRPNPEIWNLRFTI